MSALLGAGFGLLAGTGLWLAATGTPYARRPTLDSRLAPYLRDAPRPSRLLADEPTLTPSLTRILALRALAPGRVQGKTQ